MKIKIISSVIIAWMGVISSLHAVKATISSSVDGVPVPLEGMTIQGYGTPDKPGDCLAFQWQDVYANVTFPGKKISSGENDLSYYPAGFEYGNSITIVLTVTDTTTGMSDSDICQVVVPLLHTHAPNNDLSFYQPGQAVMDGSQPPFGAWETTNRIGVTPPGSATSTGYTWNYVTPGLTGQEDSSGDNAYTDVTSAAAGGSPNDQEVTLGYPGSDPESPCAQVFLTIHNPTKAQFQSEDYNRDQATVNGTTYEGWDDNFTFVVLDAIQGGPDNGHMPIGTPIYEDFNSAGVQVGQDNWDAAVLSSSNATFTCDVNGSFTDTYATGTDATNDTNSGLSPQPVWKGYPGDSTFMISRTQQYIPGFDNTFFSAPAIETQTEVLNRGYGQQTNRSN